MIDLDAIPDELQDRDQWLMWDSSADTPRRPHWAGNFSICWSDPDATMDVTLTEHLSAVDNTDDPRSEQLVNFPDYSRRTNSKKHSTTSRWSVRLAGTLDMMLSAYRMDRVTISSAESATLVGRRPRTAVSDSETE